MRAALTARVAGANMPVRCAIHSILRSLEFYPGDGHYVLNSALTLLTNHILGLAKAWSSRNDAASGEA
jgi:hypothetical protein